jgi:hypothetical protein
MTTSTSQTKRLNLALLLIVGLSFFSFSTFGQTKSDSIAMANLNASLTDKKLHNVINFKEPIIKDSTTAVAVAEPILFGIYGKDNILEQKPYKIHHINDYWLISGTLHTHVGGTFLIIIYAKDSKVIRITHGK